MERISKEAYLAKLRNPRWQKIRLQVLDRDEWACIFCGDTENTLHVHHLWYAPDREPWEYPPDALITLCEICHQTETEDLPIAVAALIQYLKKLGASSYHFDALASVFSAFNTFHLRYAPPDTWGVITFGIMELVHGAQANSPKHENLRKRYGEYVEWSRAKEKGADDK